MNVEGWYDTLNPVWSETNNVSCYLASKFHGSNKKEDMIGPLSVELKSLFYGKP